MYKIFLDQNRIFECDIKIEGANLNESEVRLFLETKNFTLSFFGEINSDGKVKIPINKLKGILKENLSGKIFLEVIAEDTVFKPWEDEYQTDVSKKVEVSFNNKLDEQQTQVKPKISFKLKDEALDLNKHRKEIFKILENNNVNKKRLYKNTKVLNKLIERYCSNNNINDINNKKTIRNDVLKNLL